MYLTAAKIFYSLPYLAS